MQYALREEGFVAAVIVSWAMRHRQAGPWAVSPIRSPAGHNTGRSKSCAVIPYRSCVAVTGMEERVLRVPVNHRQRRGDHPCERIDRLLLGAQVAPVERLEVESAEVVTSRAEHEAHLREMDMH